jgi:hypothetical protein
MFEYIEKVALIRKARQLFGSEWYTERVVSLVESQPVVDVAPVRRGHWVRVGDGTTCSECLAGMKRTDGIQTEWVDLSMMLFCPKCGSKMDKEKSHAN